MRRAARALAFLPAFTVLGAMLGVSAMSAMLAAPAAAQDIAFRGWGLRAGVSDDPDQVIVGAQANFGEFIPRLRLQPNVELGFGDDHEILSLAAPVHYRFPIDAGVTLYGGGGIVLGLDREDRPRGGTESEFLISPLLAGGVEWPAASGDLFVELNLIGGDLPNAKLLLGWMF